MLIDVSTLKITSRFRLLAQKSSSLLKAAFLVDTLAGETIGYLPTEYNYLAGCMKKKRSYGGQVSSATTKPVIRVRVDIGPQ